jgi:hypothetical protein
VSFSKKLNQNCLRRYLLESSASFSGDICARAVLLLVAIYRQINWMVFLPARFTTMSVVAMKLQTIYFGFGDISPLKEALMSHRKIGVFTCGKQSALVLICVCETPKTVFVCFSMVTTAPPH